MFFCCFQCCGNSYMMKPPSKEEVMQAAGRLTTGAGYDQLTHE